jgi:hypothetical protein
MTVDPKALSRYIVLPNYRLEFCEPLTVGRTHPHAKRRNGTISQCRGSPEYEKAA